LPEQIDVTKTQRGLRTLIENRNQIDVDRKFSGLDDLRVKSRDGTIYPAWLYVTCAALGVTGMAGRASSHWRGIRRFDG
jgi:hypothetical protein